MNSIIKASAKLFSGSAIASIFSVISTFIIANTLGVEGFGVYALIISIITFVTAISCCKTIEPTTKFLIDSDDNKQSKSTIILTAILIDLLGVIISAIFLLIIYFVFKYFKSLNYEVSLIICLVTIPLFSFVNSTAVSILRVNRSFGLLASIEVVFSAGFCVSVLLLSFKSDSYIGFIYAYWFWTLIKFLYTCTLMIKPMNHWGISLSKFRGKSLLFGSKLYKEMLIGSSLNNWLKVASQHLDIILLGILSSTSSVAVYKITKSINNIASMPTNVLYQVTFPEFITLLKNNKIQELLSLMKKLLLISLSVGCVYILGATFIFPFINELVLDKSFKNVNILLPIMLLGTTFLYVSQYWHSALIATGKVYAVTQVFIISLVVNIIALCTLAPSLDEYAAAFAFAAFCITRASLLHYKFKKLGLKLNE